MLGLSLIAPARLCAQEEAVVDTTTQLEIGTEVVEVPQATDEEAESVPDTSFERNSFALSTDSVSALKRNGRYAYIPRVDSFLRATGRNQVQAPDIKPPSVPWWIKALVSTPAKMIYWSIAIAIVLFILYRLFFAEGHFMRRHKRSSVILHDAEEEEHASGVNWKSRIAEAEQRGDYRMAIRYHHRYLLTHLHEQQWIVFTREKTNSQYLREAKSFPRHADLVRVTQVFDYVWFGHAPLSEQAYTSWKSVYLSLQSVQR